MLTRLRQFYKLTKTVGVGNALHIYARRALGQREQLSVSCKGRTLPLRPAESDPFVIEQIFGAQQYRLPQKITENLNLLSRAIRKDRGTPVIIDGGANVGYSALFFSEVYPDAVVIAVEPDYEAYSLLENCCRGNQQIKPVHGALWCNNNGVQLYNKDQPSWARSVAEGGTVPSYLLSDLLDMVEEPSPLLLKLDIEGAEYDVVESSGDLVSRFPCLMIEPHDWMFGGRGCLSPLFSTINGRKVDTLISGENIFLVDSQLCI